VAASPQGIVARGGRGGKCGKVAILTPCLFACLAIWELISLTSPSIRISSKLEEFGIPLSILTVPPLGF